MCGPGWGWSRASSVFLRSPSSWRRLDHRWRWGWLWKLWCQPFQEHWIRIGSTHWSQIAGMKKFLRSARRWLFCCFMFCRSNQLDWLSWMCPRSRIWTSPLSTERLSVFTLEEIRGGWWCPWWSGWWYWWEWWFGDSGDYCRAVMVLREVWQKVWWNHLFVFSFLVKNTNCEFGNDEQNWSFGNPILIKQKCLQNFTDEIFQYHRDLILDDL